MATFLSIKIEGGLLGPDLLDQLRAAELPGQRPADFGLEGKRNLTDEIASTFADARALWGVFQNRLRKLPDDDIATTVTRDAWMIPFLGLLGYTPTYNPRAHEVDGLSFAISHRADAGESAPPVHIVGYRQELGRVPASGRPRLAPHSLVQEYLNRKDSLWGVVTNGRIVRLLRDCTYIRRQAYVEFDLQAMLEEQRFQDFAALYRLLHRTRLPRTGESAADCLLERYYDHSREQGGRVRERLREGVERCIKLLGNGFLRHTASDDLRRRVAPDCPDVDRIAPEDFYRQLLRLVYRFLFLLVSEERGLLSTHPIYRDHYGIARLRRLLDNRNAFTDHDDVWQSLRVLWYLLVSDLPQPALSDQPMAAALGLPVLNGDLFAGQPLDEASISNRELLQAFFFLAKYEPSRTGGWQRVNYAALDVEELGSVYESLLEFHPAVERDSAGRLSFDLVRGSERKTTGSYYTPPEIVGELIKSALEPLVAERLASRPRDQERAILSIRVCDPACGSGHFLLAAARRLGKELARVRTGEDEPAPERVREAIRDVVSHCIYGVDKNPLAVDLCRVALWLEAHCEGKPLTFLDHRIRLGDSLVGVVDLQVLADGLPDAAFKPLEGDDKAVARALAHQNRDERSGQLGLFTWNPQDALTDLTSQSLEVDAIADDSPEAIRRKRELFERGHAQAAWLQQRDACNLWCAAFFQRKQPGVAGVSTAAVRAQLAGRTVDGRVHAAGQVLAAQQRFFHWLLEFPEVFADGGFDVMLGNSPWETLSPDAKEFFATYDPQVRFQDRDGQKRIISGLLQDPAIAGRWDDYCRDLYATVHFIKQSGRYRLFAPGNLGKGDFNVYRMFVETALQLTREGGWAAQVVPEGLYNGANCMAIRKALFETCQLASVFGFENASEVWFRDVDTRMKFCAYSARLGGQTESFAAGFNIRSQEQLTNAAGGSCLRVPVRLVREFSPDALAVMELGNQRDIDIAAKMYRWPAFGDETAGPPRRVYMAEIHMGNDRELFTEDASGVPLYEGRMVAQFDHRAKGYRCGRGRAAVWEDLPFSNPSKSIQPQWYIPREKIPNKCLDRIEQYRIGFCDVASPTNERTLVAAIIPTHVISGDKVPTITFPGNHADWALLAWLAIANSYAMDFLARKKVSLKMSYTVLDSLPFPRLASDDPRTRALVERSLRLTCTGPEMLPFWDSLADAGWVQDRVASGTPGELSDEARLQLRAEIDAIVARDVFELTRDELAYVLDTFPTQRRYQEDQYGEFRSRRLILEAFDGLSLPVARREAEPTPAPVRSAPTVFRSVVPQRQDRYRTCVPRIDLDAAAGEFGEPQGPGFEEWVEIRTDRPLRKGMFVARVVGRSMEPLIPDGAYCLFQHSAPRIRNGLMALCQLNDATDSETGGRFTIKRLSVGSATVDSDRQRMVRLVPENPDFSPIDVVDDSVRVVAQFLEVLRPLID